MTHEDARRTAPDPDDLVERIIASRGDLFAEFKLVAREMPDTMNLMFRASGYVHSYETLTTEDQELSGPMRELIAVAQLCAQRDDRFAANHVRRLYRMGITNRVMLEAAEAIAPVVGWSVLSHVAQAILTANDPDYPEGTLPEGGEPKELTWFPELELGRVGAAPAGGGAMERPEWRYVAGIDPELAKRGAAFVDHCLVPGERDDIHLGPGIREMIAAAALCVRGDAEAAARHIRRAYDFGLNRRKMLEAISCVFPMTGSTTLEVGARAMQRADGPE
jgi:alkylhydroperoxidase/carboxymuconolactone decarboxylase family protein YurZ